jgi:DNA-binding NtrC family response regulator
VDECQHAATLGLVQIFPRQLEAPCEVFPVSRTAVVGRAVEVDIRIADGSVSRRHARVGRNGLGLRVEDLGSSHGTFVDGRRVGSGGAELQVGSLLRVGETLLLASADIATYTLPPRQISGSFLGLARDVWGGAALTDVFAQASRLASLSQSVLILGESGSGKEAVARLVHALRDKPGPFVGINVAAIPEPLFESELFGHVRGAFTGAVQSNLGAFRQAHGGVLFLDEIGDLKRDLQVKLLRAIDQMRVRPVGASEDVPVEVRIIAATSRNLPAMCEADAFRADLYYRLAGALIVVPPLRERRDEVVALTLLTLRRLEPSFRIEVDAVEMLCRYGWEGNVRELEHAVNQAVVLALSRGGRVLACRDFSARVQQQAAGEAEQLRPSDLTREQLCTVMQGAGGNAMLAAKRLGISRASLYLLFKRHAIEPGALRNRS